MDGRILLLRRGARLDSKYKDRLIQLGFHSVFVTDHLTGDIVPREMVTPSLRFRANKTVFDILNREELLNNRAKIAALRTIAREMVAEILGLESGVLLDFPEIKTFSNYVYLHSVNVAVLGVLIGRELNLNEEKLEDFTIGALLHDIGKVKIPLEILNKQGPLTPEEYDRVKEHPRIGFDLLNANTMLKPRSYAIALQHHESMDGSGYPSGKKGEEIHIFSRIAMVVDIFDALTSDRPYKRRWSFYNTLSHLEGGLRKKLDERVLKVFMKRVPPFPLGSTVRLSTGEIGIICKNDHRNLEYPVVRIIQDPDGRDIPEAEIHEINLAENRDTQIISNIQHKPE